MTQKNKGNFAGKWLLFFLAPSIPFKHVLFKFYIWVCKVSFNLQVSSLRRALTITGAYADVKNINDPNNLYFVISETSNKEIKLSGFYAETKEQFDKEYAAVPGVEKYVCTSLAKLREDVIKNFTARRFHAYKYEQLAKNGGQYIH